MPLPTLSTTARAIVGTDKPTSFVVVNDAANTINIRVSSVDPNCSESFDVLVPGQDLSFEDFTGIVWARSASGTPTYAVEFVQPQGAKVAIKS